MVYWIKKVKKVLTFDFFACFETAKFLRKPINMSCQCIQKNHKKYKVSTFMLLLNFSELY